MESSPPPLKATLDQIGAAPADAGPVHLIVRRPAVDRREVVEEAQLDPERGLVGDGWAQRPTRQGPPDPEAQLTLINSRLIAHLAGSRERWPLAGDQLYVDLDLSLDNLPAGSLLRVGTALVSVSAKPHTGCAKFSSRFGLDALRLVNSPQGRRMRLRGVNCRVLEPGVVRVGDLAAVVKRAAAELASVAD